MKKLFGSIEGFFVYLAGSEHRTGIGCPSVHTRQDRLGARGVCPFEAESRSLWLSGRREHATPFDGTAAKPYRNGAAACCV